MYWHLAIKLSCCCCCCTWHDYDLTHKATPQKCWRFAAAWFVAVACGLRLWQPSGTTPAKNKERTRTRTENPWSTHQRHNKGEEPGVDEEVVAASLDDEDEGGSDGQQDGLHHHKLLDLVLDVEACSLKKNWDNYAVWKKNRHLCCLKKNWDNNAAWKKNWDNYAVPPQKNRHLCCLKKNCDNYAAWKRSGTIMLSEKEKKNWDNYAAWKRTGMIMLI